MQPGSPQQTKIGDLGPVKSHYLPEKFLVASMVVRIAPCNREKGAGGRGRDRGRE